ncbi:MAG: hypothetical protein AAGC92_01240 [Pseudomonadota bacterium]
MTDPAPILLHRREKPCQALSLGSDAASGLTAEAVPDVALVLGRAHEGCGPARRLFAALVAGRLSGPVLWILPAHEQERLNPDGLAGWMDPARLVLLPCRRLPDILWCMEEALRSGSCSLVVAELPAPPALTPVRRLHLAAETGGAGGLAPLGLLLTPGQGGAQGIETRWHLAPRPGWATGTAGQRAGRPRWQLSRLRARTAPEAGWIVEAGQDGLRPLTPAD